MNKCIAIETPKGRWELVGRVPTRLAYAMADGSELTDHACQAIAHCGPGILGSKIKSITYATESEALEAIRNA